MQAEHTSPAVRRSGRLAGKGADDPPPLPRKRGGGGSGGGGGGGQQRRLPHGLPHKELLAAAKHLTDSTGMAKAKAEEALIEAARRGAHVWQDWDRWMDEAQLWVAQAQEAAEEERKLREAMAASLADRDRAGQREAGPPLVNQSEERLRQKFQGSAVLGALDGVLPPNLLFSGALKHAVVPLLQLEARCAGWYPGSRSFFEDFGRECIAELGGGRSAGPPGASGPSASAAGASAAGQAGVSDNSKGHEKGKRAATASEDRHGGGAPPAPQARRPAASAPRTVSPAAVQWLAEALAATTTRVQEAVSAIPAVSGAAPSIFSAQANNKAGSSDGGSDSDGEVVLVQRGASKRRRRAAAGDDDDEDVIVLV